MDRGFKGDDGRNGEEIIETGVFEVLGDGGWEGKELVDDLI